ncbi:hypothetical protein [Alteromonas confluentis]|uniref:Galactosyl transferase n=1 Tax=Alteromonas confluentis TaxID=1656094 RepID=A0A1E7Z8R1_9ALTE|nr:hypothetical protein [Alteromonas confluentis]OFC69933.1 hypothetical protein BFC18_15890 [Alteromonas confluentis]
MNPVLSFIIPVRHHENAPSWDDTVKYLNQTVSSISNQTSGNWNCLIVANSDSVLPDFDDKRIVRINVDFEPNCLHEKGNATQDEFYESFRFDKGRRVLAALQSGLLGQFYMTVDDDDFVHAGLARFVENNSDKNGWYISEGYIWGDEGNLLMKFPEFDRKCGSSLIIRSNSFDFSNFTVEDMKKYLGSHMFIKPELSSRGLGLSELPFLGAVYRIGHRNAHSKSKSLLRQFYINKLMLSSPGILFSRLKRLRLVSKQIRQEFSLHN